MGPLKYRRTIFVASVYMGEVLSSEGDVVIGFLIHPLVSVTDCYRNLSDKDTVYVHLKTYYERKRKIRRKVSLL